MHDTCEKAIASAYEKVTIGDLEDPITRARHAAKTLEMVLDAIFEDVDPRRCQNGLMTLVIDREDREAAQHMMAEVRSRLREVSNTWEALFTQDCGSR